MISSTDQTGILVSITKPALRVVSLVPSQTELLHDLGLDEEVVGITRFCILPPHWHRTKPRIGGTKDVRIEAIAALKPDLVLANKEENVREQVESIRLFCPVWTSDVNDLPSAQSMIQSIGRLCGKERNATSLNEEITGTFDQLRASSGSPTCLYIIWKDPIMTVGGDTFINDMIKRAGFNNITEHLIRYPVLDQSLIEALQPDLVMLSSEPYPFKEKHLAEFRSMFPTAKVQLVDGMFFSWYGSRLRSAASYFSTLKSPI